MQTSVFFILFLITLTSVFDTLNQLFLKNAINALDLNVNSIRKVIIFITKLILTPKVWVGFIFCALSLCIWLFVLARADLNYAFSADSMHYILIALSAKFFLKEKVGLKRWVGTLFIVIGIVMITWSNYQPF